MNLDSSKQFIRDTFGGDVSDAYELHLDDFVCYVKSEALKVEDPCAANSETAARFKAKFERLAIGIMAEVLKAFLADNYGNSHGQIAINYNGALVYDRSLNEIPQVTKFSQEQSKIVEGLVDHAMVDFVLGLEMACRIVERLDEYVPKSRMTRLEPPPVKVAPPLEAIEIEIMRLERKLPRISREDAARLSRLYAATKETSGEASCR